MSALLSTALLFGCAENEEENPEDPATEDPATEEPADQEEETNTEDEEGQE